MLSPNPPQPLPSAGGLQVFHSNHKFGTENPRHETLKAVSGGFTLAENTQLRKAHRKGVTTTMRMS